MKKFYAAWILVYGSFIFLTHYNCFYASWFAAFVWGIMAFDFFTSNLHGFYKIVIKKLEMKQNHFYESLMDIVPHLGCYGMILALHGNTALVICSSLIAISKAVQLTGVLIGVRKCQISL